MRKLGQIDVRKLPDGAHSFGEGLYLLVRGDSRTWSLRIQVKGKRTFRGLGSAYEVTLTQARVEAAKLKVEMKEGDTRTKREKAAEERAQKTGKPTFADVWEDAVKAREAVARWKTEEQGHQWRQSISDYALPSLGKLEVAEISREDVLRVLFPIWETKTETASRLRARLEMVFDWCIRQGLREKENPARWRGQLAFDLPPRSKVQKVRHFRAASALELQAIAPRLMNSISGKCTLFGILTASRVQEFVKAKWCEINIKKKVWIVPSERRKDGKPDPFMVPLSDQAIYIIKSIERRNEYIFKGLTSAHLAPDTPRSMLRLCVSSEVTMHGCRSTFRDWCAEQGVDQVIAERCLMHNSESKVVQAYQRSDLLEQRRPVMQKWADFICAKCEALRGSSTPSS